MRRTPPAADPKTDNDGVAPDMVVVIVDAIVEALRIRELLGSANKKALQRWRTSQKEPGDEVVRRLFGNCVDEAVKLSCTADVLGLPRAEAVAALTDAAVRWRRAFESEADHGAVASIMTVGAILARTKVRALVERDGLTVAPDWLLAGRRQQSGNMVEHRPEVTRMMKRLGPQVKTDHDGGIRKRLRGMNAGSAHVDSLTDTAEEAADVLFPYRWALQELVLRFHVDIVTLIMFARAFDTCADVIASGDVVDIFDNDVFIRFLGGAMFR